MHWLITLYLVSSGCNSHPLGSVIGWKSSHAQSAVLETEVSRNRVLMPPRRRECEDPVEVEGGPCIAKVVDDAEGGTRECGRSVSSCWYGKGKLYCARSPHCMEQEQGAKQMTLRNRATSMT